MIYLLEDDDSIRNFVLYGLNNSGLPAEGFERPSLFWSALRKNKPDLVLLDIMLPEEDGLSILKKLRADSEYASMPKPLKLPMPIAVKYPTATTITTAAATNARKVEAFIFFMNRTPLRFQRLNSNGAGSGAAIPCTR